MKNLLLAATALVGLGMAVGATTAHAGFDTSLVNGLYYGNGNSLSNSGFTTDSTTTPNVEVGLDYVTRFVGPMAPTPTTGNVYSSPGGDTTVSPHTGSAVGLTYSVDLDTNNSPTPTFTLGAVSATLTVLDVATGMTASFNPLTIPDNGERSPSGVVASGSNGCSTASPACNPATDVGVQNSEALSFLPLFGDTGFNSLTPDTFVATLTLMNSAGAVLASTTAILNENGGAPVSTPEPISMSLLGVGMIGLVAARRRRKTSANDDSGTTVVAA